MKFEDAMKELEVIVNKLEKQEVDLNESLDLFKRGIELYKTCNKQLEDAKKEIKIIENGEEVDF